ncbi:uncharacterized protein N7482_005914 [Penicillium canariense]|uniref:Uncharacterized protein n=1 Tax=Penicillium canariense TaxID=189055 RepID=A0A9W9I5E5_9EURO|nr:uncharacterized protein N7482_005914 [Penicillium canariense]KAJ5167133.1 hypothetical protein N7482_005914 [Penicillium canariense]
MNPLRDTRGLFMLLLKYIWLLGLWVWSNLWFPPLMVRSSLWLTYLLPALLGLPAPRQPCDQLQPEPEPEPEPKNDTDEERRILLRKGERTARYGRFQDEGEERRRWIADPGEPDCFIPRSTLTFTDIWARYSRLVSYPENPCYEIQGSFEALGLPPESRLENVSPYRYFNLESPFVHWMGYTGPGMVLLADIGRVQVGVDATWERRRRVPPISAISQAFYERDFPIHTLRYVFVACVINENTLGFLSKQLYTQPTLNLSWPDQTPRSWIYGTPEYDGLLGTRIGKLVAYLVLGAFARGTRRISQIVTKSNHGGESACMRFDIETIAATGSG